MKNSIKALGIVVVLVICTNAYAEGPYMGASLGQLSYDEVGFATAKPTALTVKIGNKYNANFAIEGRIGIGVSDDTIIAAGIPIDLELDNYLGVYGLGILPVSDVVSLYGLAGFTNGELTASAGSIAVSGSDSSASFGLGAEAKINRSSSVNIEWIRLLDESAYELSMLSVGVNLDF